MEFHGTPDESLLDGFGLMERSSGLIPEEENPSGNRPHGFGPAGAFGPERKPRALLQNLDVTEPDLETVFIHLTGRDLRD